MKALHPVTEEMEEALKKHNERILEELKWKR